jgi:uroporphyrinogen-III decarboxylase
VSAHMPATGYFFDTINRQPEIDEDKLNPEDNLEEYQPLSDADIAYWQERVPEMRDSKRAVLGNMGGLSLGDIGRVPAPQLPYPKGIRDVSEWYMSIVMRPDYVHAVFDRQVEIALANLARFHAVVGDAIDVLYVCATDFGTQESQFCSVATFKELFLPYYRRINGWVHQHTSWKTFKHSDGALDPLLPGLINAGFDILNPVQCSAAGMDPEHLKQTYGRDLVFWGAGVDTQHTLPFGTAKEVYDEVLSRCRIFARDGGFVLSSIHNIQACTPTANVVAMLDAVRDFNSAGG